jgi:hypothetical protein
MKQFTINEIKQIQIEQGYKYVGLFDNNGNKVIPFNSNASTATARIKEIETRLSSAGLPDGFYNVSCKNALKGGSADNYLIKKGENEILEVKTEKIEVAPAVDLLSYASALKLNVEVASLKLENAALKKEITVLGEQLRENENLLSENEASDATPSMIESAKSFLSEAMGFIAPMLDKHFELKEKSLNIQAAKLNQGQNRQTPAPTVMQQPQTEKSIDTWIKQFSKNPEIYEKLAKFYNNAKTENEFLTELQNYDEELLKQLIQWKKN